MIPLTALDDKDESDRIVHGHSNDFHSGKDFVSAWAAWNAGDDEL